MIPAQPLAAASPSLSLGDIYYVIFRHKWKILFCILAGAIGAAVVWRMNPPIYESQAKLFVRYVLSDRSVGPASDSVAKSPDRRGETIMNSEREILTSIDLARQVAEAVGPEKILGRTGNSASLAEAAAVVRGGLRVLVPPASSVMYVTFSHRDPDLVQPVLREIVATYLKLHVEAHTANGMIGDFLTQETDQLRSRLSQTEDELRKATSRAGVVSVTDAKRSYSEQITAIRRDLFAAEAALAERLSTLEELTKQQPAAAPEAPVSLEAPIPPEILGEYRSTAQQLELLQRMKQELLIQFTPESARVSEIQAQILAAQERIGMFQARYPRLTQMGAVVASREMPEAINPAAIAAQINALKARTAVLKSQMTALRSEALKLDQAEGQISELQRRKDLEEANYRHYAASLEQARINEALGNGRVSNIIQVQRASPPVTDNLKTRKLVLAIFGGGIALGLAWAFLVELFVDRSIRRPIDVERTIPSPLLISIPTINRKALTAGPNGNGSNGHALATTDGSPLAVYHETLRDRLIGYFESVGLNHKPKLVAVTGLQAKSGVSTTAAGLARSLSETGEGNVLLVDMNAGHGTAQQFSKGNAVCGLDDILHTRDGAHVDQNLYVVAESSNSERLSRNMPQRFTKLVPKLKASDFDYIIFDMPPVTQISITPRLAGFMDMVLLVVESEKNDRDIVQRATRMLGETRAHVGLVLNKTRSYVPGWLQQTSLAN